VHGFGANANYWRAIYPEMSKEYRVIGIDLLGYGNSYKPMKKEKIDMSIELWSE
jgi:pimeloyl-ACP methyl ester carboxylesterase